MTRSLLIFATALVFVHPLIIFPASANDYRTKAIAYFADDLKVAGDGAKLDLKLVDLNGDGVPEALAVLTGPTACGMHGCTAEILDLTGPKARSLGGAIAFDLRPLKTKTNGWIDVGFNSSKASAKLVHRGSKYDIGR